MNPDTELARPIIEWFRKHEEVHISETTFKLSPQARIAYTQGRLLT